jgi:cytidylate kinase
MSVVILSADTGCPALEIAEKTGRALGCAFVGREVLEEAAREYRVPLEKIEEALTEPSSFFNRFSRTRTQCLAYFQAAFAAALLQENVVYYGSTGHMFVSGVSHILKVMLTASLEDRVAWKAEKQQIPEKRAREILQKETENQGKWYQSIFQVNGADPGCFDLVINLSQIDTERAMKIIVETARDVKFQPITYSLKAMEDQEVASRIRARLVGSFPDVMVRARDGTLTVQAKALKKEKRKAVLSLREEMLTMPGVQNVEIG